MSRSKQTFAPAIFQSMSIQSFTFSAGATGARADASGFGAYHDLYSAGSDVVMTGDHFAAEVTAHRLSRMIVFDRRLSGVSHSRSPTRVRRDGFDHVALQLLVSGRLVGGGPGAEREVRPGEVILFDMTRPQRTSADGARIVTISLARERIETVVPIGHDLHGAILPAPVAALLGDFMLLLARRGGELGAETAAGAGKALAELVAGSLGDLGARPASGSREVPFTALRRERAEAFIETRLADPALDVGTVAHGLGISRSVLYRLFEPSGGVAQYILGRRLERLRTALRRLTETRSIAALAFACGFASESHCNRAFRAAFGLPPGQYRSEMRHARLAGHGDDGSARSRLLTWHSELY
jgi:AraC-like DNA-binding protein